VSAPIDESDLADIEVRLWSLQAGAHHQLQIGDESPSVILDVLLTELDRLQARIEGRLRGVSA
jgi:hypothetical protein